MTAAANGLGRMFTEEPIHHVNEMDVVLDDEVAGEMPPGIPLGDLIDDLGGGFDGAGELARPLALEEVNFGEPDVTDRAGIE